MRRAPLLAALALPPLLVAWTKARGLALSPEDWRLAQIVVGVLSAFGVLALVRWVLRTAIDRAALNATIKALDSPEVQRKLGQVLRQEVLAPEIAETRAAVTELRGAAATAADCIRQWGDIGKDVEGIRKLADEAHEIAEDNRSWMEDLSHALDVAMQLERRSGGDRRSPEGAFTVPPLPAPVDRRRASDRRRRRDD